MSGGYCREHDSYTCVHQPGVTEGKPAQLEEDLRREGEIKPDALSVMIDGWDEPIRKYEDFARQQDRHRAAMIEIRQKFLALGAGLASLDALARGEHIPILRAIVDDITGVMTRLKRLEEHPALEVQPVNESSDAEIDRLIRRTMREADRMEARLAAERATHLTAIAWHLEQLRAGK